ncbi:p21-activated protein kinase-interacting protein 1-like [Styela clava]
MLKIIVGCYEQMLLGYSVTKDKEKDVLKSELLFTDHSHSGCIKTVACGSSYLASGSSDEAIFLFDMTDDKEVGSIQGHEGTVNYLTFPDKKFLMSTSDDGTINVWRVSAKWDKAKCLRGHKGPVTSFAVHPSGKLALSASPKDGTLRTWNMISGRPVYVKNMKKFSPEIVKFSPGGEHYLITSKNCLQIYELESANCIAEIEWKKAILAAEFISNKLIAVTGEGNEIHIYQTKNGESVTKIEAHTSRVKGLHRITPPKFLIDSDTDNSIIWLASASSDGHVKIWSVDEQKLTDESTSVLKSPPCVLDIDTKARVTCLTSWESKT